MRPVENAGKYDEAGEKRGNRVSCTQEANDISMYEIQLKTGHFRVQI